MSTTPEAGAIVFRTDRGSVEILLVGALKDSTKWIFPKGHLNPSESHAAAALREAAEEAGITGIVTGLVGPTLLFQSGTESVAVEYYLVRMIEEEAALEERPRRWATVQEALALLSFEDARQLLRSAAKTLEQRLNSKEAPRFEELLLHEYDHVAQSLLNSEESGEKRVTFFITLCGAVGAALAFAVGRTAIGLPERLLIATTLAVLFVLGYATYLRVIARNAASDRYKNQLSRMRQYFLRAKDDPNLRFMPFDPWLVNRRDARKTWQLGKGGWLETVALVEVLIGGAFFAFVSWTLLPEHDIRAVVSILLGAGAGAALWRALFTRAEALYGAELNDERDGSVPLRGRGRSMSPIRERLDS